MVDVLAENREMGWTALPPSAPAWVREHFIEFRMAQVEKRAVNPAYLARYNREAEQRFTMQAQIERFNQRHPTVARVVKKVFSPTITLSFREAAALSKKHGVSFQDALAARSIEQTNGVPLVDSLNHMRLRSITARVERAAELRKQDDEDLEDDDNDWNEKAHERAATAHRFVAQHSSLDVAVKHYNAADAHQKAAENFNRTNSRAARRASKKASEPCL